MKRVCLAAALGLCCVVGNPQAGSQAGPNTSPGTRDGGGDWLDTDHPVAELRPGFSGAGLTIEGDGATFFNGAPVFPPAQDPSGAVVRLFPSPDQARAIAMQWDLDWGGLRVALLDLAQKRVVRADLIPETAVRGNGSGPDVRVALLPIAWSPDSRFAVYLRSAEEWRADPVLLDAATGATSVLAPNDLAPGTWSFPDLTSLRWDDRGLATMRYDVLRCADADCTAPEKVGVVEGSVGVSARTFEPGLPGNRAQQATEQRRSGSINVGERVVSWWLSPQGSDHVRFAFDLNGYENTYLLDCHSRRFLWTENRSIATGEITDNAQGSQWRPLNAGSAISNAVFEAACPEVMKRPALAGDSSYSEAGLQAHAEDAEALTRAELLRREREYKSSFAELCADPYTRESGLPCPYIAKSTCEGEACVTRGPMRATQSLALVAFPGSDRIVARVQPDEYVFAEYGEVWLAPCMTRVTTKADPALPHAGEFFWRLQYVGEGFFEYWSPTQTEQFEEWSADTISASVDPKKDPCNTSTHAEWLLLATKDGQRGWTAKPKTLAGSDRYGSERLVDVPGWVVDRQNREPLAVGSVYESVLLSDGQSTITTTVTAATSGLPLSDAGEFANRRRLAEATQPRAKGVSRDDSGPLHGDPPPGEQTMGPFTIRAQLPTGMRPDEVVNALKSAATERSLLFVGESPFYKQVQAVTGEPYRYVNFLSFAHAAANKTLLDQSDEFAAYLPIRIAVVEDAQGRLWLHTLDFESIIALTGASDPSIRDVNALQQQVTELMKSVADGDF